MERPSIGCLTSVIWELLPWHSTEYFRPGGHPRPPAEYFFRGGQSLNSSIGSMIYNLRLGATGARRPRKHDAKTLALDPVPRGAPAPTRHTRPARPNPEAAPAVHAPAAAGSSTPSVTLGTFWVVCIGIYGPFPEFPNISCKPHGFGSKAITGWGASSPEASLEFRKVQATASTVVSAPSRVQ